MKKEKMTVVFQKSMEVNPVTGEPLLLFVTYGQDEEKKMNFVRIRGISNPLPFKEVYGICGCYLESWLKSHGWKKVGHRRIEN